MRKRICLATTSYPLDARDGSAAAGLFVRDVALELVRRGHEVFVLTQAREAPFVADPGVTVLAFDWLAKGKRAVELKARRPRELAALASLAALGALACARAARRYRFDRVIAFWAVPAGLWARAARLAAGTPYVVWALGSDIWLWGRRRLARPLLAAALDGAEEVFADGVDLRDETQRLTRKPVEFLASARVLHPSAAAPARGSELVCVARFHPHKGVDLLIEALALMPSSTLAGVTLSIYGDGELEASLKARTIALGLHELVSFKGYADESALTAALQRAAFLVIPSRLESIPLVFSDALQCGCPVVGTNVGDLGRLITENGVGIACEPTAAALADALATMLGDRNRARYAEPIRECAKRFELGATVSRLVAERS